MNPEEVIDLGSGHLLARLHKKKQRSGLSRQKNTALSSAYLVSGVAKPLLEGFQGQTWIRHTHTHASGGWVISGLLWPAESGLRWSTDG